MHEAKRTRTRKCVEYRRNCRGAAHSKLPHRRFERLRHCRKYDTLHPSKSCDRKTKDKKCRSRGKYQEGRLQFHGCFENPKSQNVD